LANHVSLVLAGHKSRIPGKSPTSETQHNISTRLAIDLSVMLAFNHVLICLVEKSLTKIDHVADRLRDNSCFIDLLGLL